MPRLQRSKLDGGVFGGLRIAGYLGHLSYRVFNDSLVFPFTLSLIGLAIM